MFCLLPPAFVSPGKCPTLTFRHIPYHAGKASDRAGPGMEKLDHAIHKRTNAATGKAQTGCSLVADWDIWNLPENSEGCVFLVCAAEPHIPKKWFLLIFKMGSWESLKELSSICLLSILAYAQRVVREKPFGLFPNDPLGCWRMTLWAVR
jgi:hypothetical protein